MAFLPVPALFAVIPGTRRRTLRSVAVRSAPEVSSVMLLRFQAFAILDICGRHGGTMTMDNAKNAACRDRKIKDEARTLACDFFHRDFLMPCGECFRQWLAPRVRVASIPARR